MRSVRLDVADNADGGFRSGSPEYRSSSSALAARPTTKQEPRML